MRPRRTVKSCGKVNILSSWNFTNFMNPPFLFFLSEFFAGNSTFIPSHIHKVKSFSRFAFSSFHCIHRTREYLRDWINLRNWKYKISHYSIFMSTRHCYNCTINFQDCLTRNMLNAMENKRLKFQKNADPCNNTDLHLAIYFYNYNEKSRLKLSGKIWCIKIIREL